MSGELQEPELFYLFFPFNHDISPIFPHVAFASSEIKGDAYSLIFIVVAYLLRSPLCDIPFSEM